MKEILNNVADWALLTALPGIGLFIFYYATRSPWKKMFVGRTMMYLAIALATLLVVNTASTYLGSEYPFRAIIRIIAYAGLSVTAWRLFFTLRHVQKTPPPIAEDKGIAVREIEDLDHTGPIATHRPDLEKLN